MDDRGYDLDKHGFDRLENKRRIETRRVEEIEAYRELFEDGDFDRCYR